MRHKRKFVSVCRKSALENVINRKNGVLSFKVSGETNLRFVLTNQMHSLFHNNFGFYFRFVLQIFTISDMKISRISFKFLRKFEDIHHNFQTENFFQSSNLVDFCKEEKRLQLLPKFYTQLLSIRNNSQTCIFFLSFSLVFVSASIHARSDNLKSTFDERMIKTTNQYEVKSMAKRQPIIILLIAFINISLFIINIFPIAHMIMGVSARSNTTYIYFKRQITYTQLHEF